MFQCIIFQKREHFLKKKANRSQYLCKISKGDKTTFSQRKLPFVAA